MRCRFSLTFALIFAFGLLIAPFCAMGQTVSLDLDNEDLGKVILMLFRQYGANIVVDKDVDVGAKITTKLVEVPLKVALDQILKAYGYGHKETESGIIRILPIENLISKEQILEVEPVETKIFSIKHIDTMAIATVVQELTTDSGKVVAEPQIRKLLVADTVSNLRKIEITISQLDQKMELEEKEKEKVKEIQAQKEAMAKVEKRLVKLNYADPARVGALISSILSEHGKVYVIQPSSPTK